MIIDPLDKWVDVQDDNFNHIARFYPVSNNYNKAMKNANKFINSLTLINYEKDNLLFTLEVIRDNDRFQELNTGDWVEQVIAKLIDDEAESKNANYYVFGSDNNE